MPDIVIDVGTRRLSISADDVGHVIDLDRLSKHHLPQHSVVGLCSHDGQVMPTIWLGDGPLPATGLIVPFRGAPVVVAGRIDMGDDGEPLHDALEASLG